MWGITAEDLLPIAEANTPLLYPLQVSYMPDLTPTGFFSRSRWYMLMTMFTAASMLAFFWKSLNSFSR